MPRKKQILVEEPSYEVECINAARVTEGAQWEYNIKWGGYSEEENSWEPEANLGGCIRMMTEFWQQVGPDQKARGKHFPVGHTMKPSTLWIRRQRASYQRNQTKISQKNKQKVSKIKDGGEGRLATPPSASASDFLDGESDDDDVPLSLKAQTGFQASVTDPEVTISKIEDGPPASSSKRKRDDDLTPEPQNKRPKPTVPDGFSTANIQANTPTSKPDESGGFSPLASPHDSLFDGRSNSEDIPLATRPSTASGAAGSQSAQPQQTTSSLHPSMEMQQKEKPKLPLHVHRKKHPRVKLIDLLDLPLLDANLGISTKNRILSQSKAKAVGSNPAIISMPDGSGGPSSSGFRVSPLPAESTDVARSNQGTPDLDANTWLKENIMSKDQLARADISRPSSTEPSTMISAAQQLPRFSKRWRWTGQLAVGDNESGYAEPVGNIVITDNTPLDRNAGKYTISILQTVLRDFKLSQFAVMTADQSDEENAFDDVVSYMTRYELFSQTSLSIAELDAATMFVFPSACLHLLDNLGLPAKVRQGRGLIIAIGFQAYSWPKRALGDSVTTDTEDWKTGSKIDIVSETCSLDYSQALLALSFPEGLLQRLANKQCTIFTTPKDKDLPGHDSMALISVLQGTSGCKIVPLLTGNARFVFIHVSAWGMLHKLPGLVDRRLRRPDIHFYTYGSDPSVERKRWGVREVFPLGGIVTFTPRAIVEDPAGVEQLISKLDQHPLWACYVLPSVVSMLCDIAEESEEGSAYCKRSGIDALCSITLPIEKGQIALTWQPPRRTAHDANEEPELINWTIDQAKLSELDNFKLALECQKRFKRRDFSEKDVEAWIVKDLLVMQSELREEYRRFVIITDTTGPCNTSKEAASSTSASKADIIDGFELTHVKDFNFNDDYFSSDKT